MTQPYEGFDDLLDALSILRADGETLPHLVLAAVGELAGHLVCPVHPRVLS